MYSKLACIASILLISSVLNAQTVEDRTKTKAENKANQRVDARIDQGIDRGLDAIEGLFKKKDKKQTAETETVESSPEPTSHEKSSVESSSSSDEQEAAMASAMQGLFTKAEWESSYSFDLASTVLITTTNKRGKSEENTMRWMVGEDALGMEMQENKKGEAQGFIIFDYDNKSFITLTENDGEKTGMAMAMNMEQINALAMETAEEESNIDANFKRTGKTKTILGHTCHQYTYTDGSTSGEMWMAEKVPSHMAKMARMLGGSKGKPSGLPENYPSGHVMEMNNTDSESGESMSYLVTKLDTSGDITFDLGPYNVMDMVTMMQMGGK